jgi:hypothetical protein
MHISRQILLRFGGVVWSALSLSPWLLSPWRLGRIRAARAETKKLLPFFRNAGYGGQIVVEPNPRCRYSAAQAWPEAPQIAGALRDPLEPKRPRPKEPLGRKRETKGS